MRVRVRATLAVWVRFICSMASASFALAAAACAAAASVRSRACWS